jgi:prolipoprotein diacylglyceryltransferase
MERIAAGLLSLTLIVPYIFCFYFLVRVLWESIIISTNTFEVFGTVLMSIFFIAIMIISGILLIAYSYSSIQKEK